MTTCAILSIGDELVAGEALDTNGQWLSAELAARGVPTIEHRTVGDDRALIARTLGELLARADLVVTTGGLGPTDDDLTRYGLADVVDPGRELVVDEAARAHLERRYAARGRPMPASNHRQALRPASSRMLPNPNGTAPGLAAEVGASRVFALPGPPAEMRPMFLDHVLPGVADGERLVLLRRVHAYGLGESAAAERLGELMERGRDPQVGITVSGGVVTARIRAIGARADAEARIEPLRRRIVDAWEPYAFGEEDDTLAQSAGRSLLERGVTVATAESCTGGWLGKLIVDVAGSSAWYRGGWVTYTNELKASALGVPASLIAERGAVSDEVAGAMARGAVAAGGPDLALAITGIAGPGGGTAAKPVGTVFVALATNEGLADVRRLQIAGDRAAIRERSAQSALQMLRWHVLGVPRSTTLLWEVVSR